MMWDASRPDTSLTRAAPRAWWCRSQGAVEGLKLTRDLSYASAFSPDAQGDRSVPGCATIPLTVAPAASVGAIAMPLACSSLGA